jgi:ABC-type lipopolysaccharide export system ATPase subunit
MIEHTISNPDFRRFLKRYSKPVIIIDDCEMLLNDAFSRSNMFVNNLMQMVDGFLSDSIEANILTIFNVEDENEIDHSLLDCNNLLRVIEFPELSSEESTDLSSHIGLNKKYKNKMRVLDIIRNNKPRESHEMGF